ncbi:hypothetical protein WCE00_12715 [Acinetobacter haemolyticus]|uniref:hypothetical protein n=1 Tax=Acinetobacter haemolyticus TaxID=29430 RepID=UPI002056B484|nr:MAG TPA: hypothetical protein [Caudoviricetes sp.]DAH86461.1 MAG TPA: hypothetical protein [Caudoviricetes sp.]
MNKLDLCPLQESYSVKYGTSVERIALRGGFGRYIQTKNAKKHLVDVSFTLREDDFIYFRAFYLNWQLNPLPFLMSLIIEDSEFREYITQFVPDSFSFNELSGKIFKVSAQLVVVTSEVQILTSKPYPTSCDESGNYSINIVDVVMRELIIAHESHDESGSYSIGIEDVSMREILNTYNTGTESGNYSIDIDSVSMRELLVSQNAGTETGSYSVEIADVQITHTVNYIEYTSENEPANYSVAIEDIQITN